MELNNNDAAVHTDSADAQAGTVSAGEIDLYDELIAFAELSPEEQLRLLDRSETVSAETEITSADQAQENTFSEPVLTHAPIEPVEAEIAVAETVTASTEEVEGHTSTEQVLTHLPIEPVEAETTAAETVTPSTEEAEAHTSPVPGAESASDAEVLNGYVEPGKGRPESFAGSRPSGPLSGFNLPPTLVYTGALSPGVCLTCGADSAADDLFCITCGVFLDEVGSTLSVNPTCAECQQGIEVDEIFCPWCGSPLPGA